MVRPLMLRNKTKKREAASKPLYMSALITHASYAAEGKGKPCTKTLCPISIGKLSLVDG